MRTKVSKSEVLHFWANQTQHEASVAGGSMYFKGQTIYSYGSHFPMATIFGNDVLMTLRGYSNTTAKHLSGVRGAISHKNIIWCYEVPTNIYNWGQDEFTKDKAKKMDGVHAINFTAWKNGINNMAKELENKRNRPEGRLAEIATHIDRLNKYCTFFGIKYSKDKELTKLVKQFSAGNFVEIARQAGEKRAKEEAAKIKRSLPAYGRYIALWRAFDVDGLKNMTPKDKEAVNYHVNKSDRNITRLRFDKETKRIETSKGVFIPAMVAKKAYEAIKGCLKTEKGCDNLAVPVMSFHIQKANNQFVIAGCHTVPIEDVLYIVDLLGWNKSKR